jgi:hypothetical protein
LSQAGLVRAKRIKPWTCDKRDEQRIEAVQQVIGKNA